MYRLPISGYISLCISGRDMRFVIILRSLEWYGVMEALEDKGKTKAG